MFLFIAKSNTQINTFSKLKIRGKEPPEYSRFFLRIKTVEGDPSKCI